MRHSDQVITFIDTAVNAAKPKEGRRTEYRLRSTRGNVMERLVLEVLPPTKRAPKPRRVWRVHYPIVENGKRRERKVKIGDSSTRLATVKERWTQIKTAADSGRDPREDKPKQVVTFAAVLEQFLERHVRPNCSPTHAHETERILRREALPCWRTMPVASITRGHIITLLDTIKDRGALIMANRCKAALSKLFRFAVERGHIELSPMMMIRAPSRERQRERVLNDAELTTVWMAASTLTPTFASWFRFHLATGQRLNETAGLRWCELDLDSPLWVLPAERSKNGKAHSVPLPDLALAQLAELPRFGEHVFTTTGTGPIRPGSKIKRALHDASGVDGWGFHDCRRSCATWLEGAGYSEKEIGLLLNHARQGVTSLYARHDLLETKRRMLAAWAEHLAGLLT